MILIATAKTKAAVLDGTAAKNMPITNDMALAALLGKYSAEIFADILNVGLRTLKFRTYVIRGRPVFGRCLTQGSEWASMPAAPSGWCQYCKELLQRVAARCMFKAIGPGIVPQKANGDAYSKGWSVDVAMLPILLVIEKCRNWGEPLVVSLFATCCARHVSKRLVRIFDVIAANSDPRSATCSPISSHVGQSWPCSANVRPRFTPHRPTLAGV